MHAALHLGSPLGLAGCLKLRLTHAAPLRCFHDAGRGQEALYVLSCAGMGHTSTTPAQKRESSTGCTADEQSLQELAPHQVLYHHSISYLCCHLIRLITDYTLAAKAQHFKVHACKLHMSHGNLL